MHQNLYKGFNSRLDELQATILRVKLKGLDRDSLIRNYIATYYLNNINNLCVTLPVTGADNYHGWQVFMFKIKTISKSFKK